MTVKKIVFQRQDIYDIIEIITENTNNYQYTSLKKFHVYGGKKIIYRTYYDDKSSVFVSLTLDKDNCPVEGLIDINTYKRSKKSINGTYRIEFFHIGCLNGKPSCLAFLSFISRGGSQTKIMDITLVDSDIPKTIKDLDMLLTMFKEKICSLSGRTYISELFKVSTLYSQLELLDREKENLSSDEQIIVNEIVESLTCDSQIPKL